MTSFINKFRKKREGDIGNGTGETVNHQPKKPELAYSLDKLLVDSHALSYFIQFLEASEKLNLIKFWMHVQGFQATFNEGVTAAQELSFRDARSIYDKYIDEGSNCTLAVPRKIKAIIDEEMQKSPLQINCFQSAQQFVRQLFEFRYFDEFRQSVYYKKHELEVLEAGCSISEILKIQPILLGFLEFLRDEKEDHDLVQFLLSCESFEANFEEMEDDEALGDAMALYDKYFSMQATNPINSGAPIRSEMESLICDESGRPNKNCFKNAYAFCYFRLQDKYLTDFVRSSSFQQYLLDLRNFIENTVELPRKTRQSSSSCSSSADSQSHSYSFNFSTPKKSRKNVEFSSDSDPEKTPKTTPRSSRLAEIDEIGKYHALYDDSHTQIMKTPTRLKSTLQKYLNKSTLREEEIAEEVARTIIKDMQKMVAENG
ncbi:unnamed protein product [Caenorhabditis angaria]|uniref:RGS domain-containing protein n=1 Tax=Caenorhabditis angaria TaxID=860376 RepID=A0A9P1ILQ9_9PELO|nr:unnamed protein product [Caenorhabditis angaria]